jgi:hypothetical protein
MGNEQKIMESPQQLFFLSSPALRRNAACTLKSGTILKTNVMANSMTNRALCTQFENV